MSQTAIEKLRAYRADFELFARDCLRIRTKEGKFVPFVMNESQRYLHEKLEEQRAEHGWIRALVLKGRQQGVSTYVSARYYWRTSLHKGINTYILSHEQSSSDALFSMVDRYQRNNPIAPHVGTANVKELVLDRLESTYQVATAGAKEGGRGRSITLFHGSEAAFWNNAPAHFAASVQAVPLAPNTEVILETTSAGPNGEFYERWQDGEAENGDYRPVFLPWFLAAEYTRDVPLGFELFTDADDGEMSEAEYAELYDLSLGQMAWRRAKIFELRSAQTFKREYPADPSEAWTDSGKMAPFIDPLLVMRARKRVRQGIGPKLMGIDPTSGGGDRFSIAIRQGLKLNSVKYRNRIDPVEAMEWADEVIQAERPDKVYIDAGGGGAQLISMLRARRREYGTLLAVINFGGTSQAKLARPKMPGPKNRRAEMYERSLEWLQLPEGVQIPDDSVLQSDATATRRKATLTNDLLLESKDEMKARGVRSPDLWDAVVLTFASLEFIEARPGVAVPHFGLIDAPGSANTTLPVMDYSGGDGSWMG